MIADSEYRLHEMPLSAGWGALAGALASAAMLLLLVILAPMGGRSAADILSAAGALFSRASQTQTILGALIHVITGALLGVLHAVSQHQTTLKGYLGTGIFYGAAIWIFGNLLAGAALPAAGALLRHWSWLAATVLYGLVLGAGAAWVDGRRPQDVLIVPKD